MNILKTGFDNVTIGVELSLCSLANRIGKAISGRGLVATGDVDGTHVNFE